MNLSNRFVVLGTPKTGDPRLAPLSDQGFRRTQSNQLMKRSDEPSPKAWRRGRAADALKRGINQVSVQTAAGWSSGAMVARYFVCDVRRTRHQPEFRDNPL